MAQAPDRIMARDDGPKFKPHPEGSFAAICVDVIDLGRRLETFGGKIKVQPKCALVFATGRTNEETGEPFFLHPEFTVSMHEKASLRGFLESWRGKSYTEEQAQKGVPVDKLVGQLAWLTVEHKTSGSGRTYAKIRAVSPVPPGIEGPHPNGYVRPEFWQKRKEEYAEEVRKHLATEAQHAGEADDFPPPIEAGDDDLPF